MNRFSSKLNWMLMGLLVVLAAPGLAIAKRKLHVIVIGDTEDAKIGTAAGTDIGSVDLLFGGHVNKHELNLVTFGTGITERSVMRAIRELNATREDAICFYYSGHGAYGRGGRGHYLVTGNSKNWISRTRVEQEIQRQGVGLGVVITDACFNLVDIDVPKRFAAGKGIAEETSPLFRRLFFRTNGFISINSCQRDQLAGCFPDQTKGSIFTRAFVDSIQRHNGIESIGWNEIFSEVSTNTAKNFRKVFPSGETVEIAGDFKNQLTQTPTKLSFNIRPYRPGSGSGGQPGIQGLQVTETDELRIDPNNGKVYATTVKRTYNPQTGQISIDPSRERYEGDAQLVYALNRHAYYRYGQLMVRANKPDGEPTRPDPSESGKRYLGVTARNALGPGVLVIKVNAGSPATQMKDNNGKNWFLENGDRILSIGGRATNNEAEYVAAVQGAPRFAEITIISNRRRMTFTVDLTDNRNAPPPPNRRGLRFGATAVARRGGGVLLTVVERGSPATKCKDRAGNTIFLEVNDVITSINGQPTNSERQYVQAVSSSPRQMSFEIYNSRDGSRMRLTTLLRY